MAIDAAALGSVFAQLGDPIAIPGGDMPGDRVRIEEDHVRRARLLLPPILERLPAPLSENPAGRAVLSVHGGSGVGKSEIGALLAYALGRLGLGAYVLSGDNYPHRIPRANDAERRRRFREYGYKAFAAAPGYGPEADAELKAMWAEGADADADPARCDGRPWLAVYQDAGAAALRDYLGTPEEIDFAELNRILAAFRDGAPTLLLKRMGREETELWYDAVDVRGVQVLVLEWTHGNSRFLAGVDVPVLLHSTPEETLAHRRARARDGAVDSPFTMRVLGIEQEAILARAGQAAVIQRKSGEIVPSASRPERTGGG